MGKSLLRCQRVIFLMSHAQRQPAGRASHQHGSPIIWAPWAGDLALYISAYGGVFLTGGVLQKNEWIFQNPHSCAASIRAGATPNSRVNMPIYLYRNSNFGLEGAINAMTFDPDLQ